MLLDRRDDQLKEKRIETLREFLNTISPGEMNPGPDFDRLHNLLAACWHEFDGAGEYGMHAGKLDRMEAVAWYPPILTFLIERHGPTVMGSTYAKLHCWTVALDKQIAQCDPSAGQRQVRKREPNLNVNPLADEIVQLIAAGADDHRLKWSDDRSQVRVLVGMIISRDGPMQTVTGRRKRWRKALKERLEHTGWSEVPNTYNLYQRNT